MAKNWAICIGVNQYNNLPNLKYTGRDAKRMQDFLLQKLKFDKVYLFTDDSPPIIDGGKPFASQPTYGTLKRFLRVRFNKSFLSAGDNLWFFFSGHGLRHRDRDYLMPTDGDPHPEGVEDTAISLHYVTERLRRCGGDNVVLFLDACRNEQASKGLGIGEDKQKGVITVASCSPAERAYEIDEIHQGSFTYALLEALQIQGEGNCATVERLNQRLQYRVNEINQRYSKPRQTPYVIAEPASKYHLILLPKQATLADIENLKKDALSAEVKNNLALAKQLWIRVLALSPADSEALDAYERIILKQSGYPVQTSSKQSRPNRQQSGNHSGSKSSPHRSKGRSNTSIQIPRITFPHVNLITRRRLLQGAGLVSGGMVATWLGRTLFQFISDSSRNTSQKDNNNIPATTDQDNDTDITSDKQTTEKIEKYEKQISDNKYEFAVFTVNERGKVVNREIKTAEFLAEDLGNGIALEMVSIPGGEFIMGSPSEEKGRYDNEQPQHKVTIQPFYMGKFQVNQAQWKVIESLPKIEHELNSNPFYFKGDSLPVENISWYEAVEFCARLSKKTGKEYRLPSEAEWEYACRAIQNSKFKIQNEEISQNLSYPPFYFGETLTDKLANYYANYTYAEESNGEYRQKTTPVGSFPPNAFGLYDMHGNVWECCTDYWHDNYEGAPDDGSAWLKGGNQEKRVVRGGSWFTFPRYCRSACRKFCNLGGRYDGIGFRVMCEARGL